mmetsp:Transcript_95509/g.270404  ORF Transcript_95509/g.270404 Transcript_95509/m.270404 type:complete len:202 (+) Transcript_95509:16-621(+)
MSIFRGFLGSSADGQPGAGPGSCQSSLAVPERQPPRGAFGAPPPLSNGHAVQHDGYGSWNAGGHYQGQEPEDGAARSMVRHDFDQRVAHHVAPPAAAGCAGSQAPTVQLIFQNNSTVNTTQTTVNGPPSAPPPPPRRSWETLKGALAEFVSSPVNRICMLGILGLAFTICQGSAQHRNRMEEMQRRIDRNYFLRFVQQLFS